MIDQSEASKDFFFEIFDAWNAMWETWCLSDIHLWFPIQVYFFTHFLESFFIDKIQWWSKMTTTENLVVILVVISGQSGLVKSGVLLEQF